MQGLGRGCLGRRGVDGVWRKEIFWSVKGGGVWREKEYGGSPSSSLSIPPFLTPSLSLSPFLRGLPDRITCEQTTCQAPKPRGVHNALELF